MVSNMAAIDTLSSPDHGVSSAEKGMTKPDTQHAEVVLREFSAIETKKLLRKIDRTLLPLLSLLYLLSFLDRASIGNARLAGLEDDLDMTGKWDYSVRTPMTLAMILP